MTYFAPESIASGCPYVVTDVAGRAPAALEDFVGNIAFTAMKDQQTHQVDGTGAWAGAVVRFNEKDDSTGKDLRVWQITATPTQQFEAQTIANY